MTSGSSFDEFHVPADRERAFKEFLKSARTTLGLSQMQAAERSGLAQTVISSLERGPYPGMRLWDIWRLCDTYGIEVDHVLETLGWVNKNKPVESEQKRKIDLLCHALSTLPEDRLEPVLQTIEGYVTGIQSIR